MYFELENFTEYKFWSEYVSIQKVFFWGGGAQIIMEIVFKHIYRVCNNSNIMASAMFMTNFVFTDHYLLRIDLLSSYQVNDFSFLRSFRLFSFYWSELFEVFLSFYKYMPGKYNDYFQISFYTLFNYKIFTITFISE